MKSSVLYILFLDASRLTSRNLLKLIILLVALTGHVQKVATPGGSGPLIIQQQQQQTQQTLQKAMVQQIQDLLKQQHRQQGGATIQQVIAATPQQQSSGATVIGTQIMSSQVAAAKASLPVATASSVLSQQVNTARSVTPIMVTAVPSGGNSLATVITTQAMMAGTVNITLAAPSSGSGGDTATLLKEVQQEVLVSPQKGLTTVVGGVAKTLHAVPQQQAVTVRHISGASLTQGPVAATAQALTPQHTIIKQQALAGKQSTIVGGQQVALRQAVGVQPSQQQLAAAIVRQHGISVQQPQTVTVHQSPGGATTRPVSIAVQQGLRPGVTVRQAVAAPSVVSVQQSAVRPAGTATVQHVQTVRPPHTVTIQKSQTAAMQQVLQEVQQQAQAQAQQRHQVSSASVTSVSSATATVVTQSTLPQSPTVVTVSQSPTESTADNAAATTTAQQLGNKSYAMRLRNQRS